MHHSACSKPDLKGKAAYARVQRPAVAWRHLPGQAGLAVVWAGLQDAEHVGIQAAQMCELSRALCLKSCNSAHDAQSSCPCLSVPQRRLGRYHLHPSQRLLQEKADKELSLQHIVRAPRNAAKKAVACTHQSSKHSMNNPMAVLAENRAIISQKA